MMVLGAMFFAGDALTRMAAAFTAGSDIFLTDMSGEGCLTDRGTLQ